MDGQLVARKGEVEPLIIERGPAIMESAALFPLNCFYSLILIFAVDRARCDWNPELLPDLLQAYPSNIVIRPPSNHELMLTEVCKQELDLPSYPT